MKKLFIEGGSTFMGLLTIVLTIIVILIVFYTFLIIKKDFKKIDIVRSRIKYIKSLGLFGMVLGFLGQMVGLYAAFGIIQEVTDISPSILAGGLKVSMIAPIYGVLIFLFSYIAWFVLDYLASRDS